MTAAIPVQVTRFRCPFCRRSWSSKRAANNHVATCWKDPSQRSCKTCLHHEPGESGGCTERGGCQCQDIPEGCCLPLDSFPEGHVFLDRDGKPLTDETWWSQRDCPLWEPAAWIKEPAW